MKPKDAIKYLIGKTISNIHQEDCLWPLCIDIIEFTDGSCIWLSGNADSARINDLRTTSGSIYSFYTFEDN